MIIYKTTNLINGKIYIGQDSRNNPNYLGSGVILIKAIKKYGKENFKKETLEHCDSKELMDIKEQYWINFYNTTNNTVGYNISNGGGGCLGCKISEETKQKLSKNFIGKTAEERFGKEMAEIISGKISKAHKGKIFTKTHKENISKNHADVSGEKNPMYGKTHTKEVREATRQRNLGRKASKKTLEKMSEQRKGEGNAHSKLTEQEVLLIRELWFTNDFTQQELAKKFNVNPPCIYKIVNYRTWKHI